MRKQKEIWKTILDYPAYEVSNLGRIRTKKTGRIRKTVTNKRTGYEMIMLCKNCSYTNHYVHRLVAQAFLINSNPDKYTDVDHIDGDRLNNNVLNLRYMSHGDNLCGRGKYVKYRNRSILQIDVESGAIVAVWSDYLQAGRALGIRPNEIAKVLDSEDTRHKSRRGYTFKFARNRK